MLNPMSIPSKERALLEEINRDLPQGVDWKEGARTYIRDVFAAMGQGAGQYLQDKPFAYLFGDNEDNSLENFHRLLTDFANVIAALRLPVESRILDIACGSGWMSHFLTKLGYDVIGIDISEEMIGLARERLKQDRHVRRSESNIDGMFIVHDIETGPVRIGRPADAAIFESSLHHFYDPVAALRHLSGMLAEDGLVVLIEGENRRGPLRPYHVEVVKKYRTLERPYSRSELITILQLAGFPAYEFFCPVSAWISPRSEEAKNLHEYVRHHTDNSNRCICAKNQQAIERCLPWWTAHRELDFEPVEGLWWATGTKLWSRPYSTLRLLRPFARLAIDIGSQIPHQSQAAQAVSVYRSDGSCHQVILRSGEEQPKRIVLEGVRQDEHLHLCSDRALSPAWSGEADSRVLSFWIELMQE